MSNIVIGDYALDTGLLGLQVQCDKFYLLSQLPSSFADVLTYALGNYVFGAGNAFGAPTAASPSGRQVSSVALSTGSIATGGTASYWAAVDSVNSRLLLYGPISSPVPVSIGDLFSMPTFVLAIGAGISSATAILLAGQTGPGFGISLPASDAGSLIGAITVTTTGGTYVGSIILSGADAGEFTLSNGGVYPCNLLIGASNIGAGTFHITLTTNP